MRIHADSNAPSLVRICAVVVENRTGQAPPERAYDMTEATSQTRRTGTVATLYRTSVALVFLKFYVELMQSFY